MGSRVPDELGQKSDRAIIEALSSLGSARIKSVWLDWNSNVCSVVLYVCDSGGNLVLLADGEPLTAQVEFPIYAAP